MFTDDNSTTKLGVRWLLKQDNKQRPKLTAAAAATNLILQVQSLYTQVVYTNSKI